jgi:hypothetical protein
MKTLKIPLQIIVKNTSNRGVNLRQLLLTLNTGITNMEIRSKPEINLTTSKKLQKLTSVDKKNTSVNIRKRWIFNSNLSKKENKKNGPQEIKKTSNFNKR